MQVYLRMILSLDFVTQKFDNIQDLPLHDKRIWRQCDRYIHKPVSKQSSDFTREMNKRDR
jgi:hypothetical protein